MAMELFFAGADQPVSRKQLLELGASNVAVSFYEWRQRYMDNDLSKRFAESATICLTAGVAKKEAIDFDLFAQDYAEFCEHNADHVALVFDLDAVACPVGVRRTLRARLDGLNHFVAFPFEDEDLSELSKRYEWIGINSRLAKSIPSRELRRMSNHLCGSNVTDQKILTEARFAATTTHTWLSARRYGELWVFAGGRLKHYSAQNRPRAVHRHQAAIEAFGVDLEACRAGQPEALTALAVRSLQAMAQHLSTRPRDRSGSLVADITQEDPPQDLVHDGSPEPAAPLLPVAKRDPIMLPTLVVNSRGEGETVASVDQSFRQCDSCYLAEHCPKYDAHQSCAYEIPVTIRTEAQWKSACQALLEIQFRRVNFGSFAEQIEGGTTSPKVGQEMDRFFRMLKDLKTLETPISEEGSSGLLTKIFKKAFDDQRQDVFDDVSHQVGSDDDVEEDGEDEGNEDEEEERA